MTHGCQYSFDVSLPDCHLLLEEKLFFEFLKNHNGEDIIIEVTGKKVKLIDDYGGTSFTLTSPTEYPQFGYDEETTTVCLSTSMLESIREAKTITDTNNKNYDFPSYVFLREDFVTSTDIICIYNRKFGSIPEMILSKDACGLLSNMHEAHFNEVNNKYFFYENNTCYSVVKNEVAFPAIEHILAGRPDKITGKIDKEMFERFCNMAVGIESRFSQSVITPSEQLFSIKLHIDDAEAGRSVEMNIPSENMEEFIPFKFDHRKMVKYLSAIPYDYINIKIQDHKLYITSDENENLLLIVGGFA